MIVFLNNQKKIVTVYSKTGIEEYLFDEIEELTDALANNSFLYVTNAVSANADQLIQLVKSLTGETYHDPNDNRILYLHTTKKGAITIPMGGETLSLRDYSDCRPVDQKLAYHIEHSPDMRALLKNGTLELINHAEMTKVIRQKQRENNKAERLKKKSGGKDFASGISCEIIDSSISATEYAESGLTGADDANVIDLDYEEETELNDEQILRGEMS